MIRRYPQRPPRRPHQDFHFFAAGDPTRGAILSEHRESNHLNPVANLEPQLARTPQITESPAPAPQPTVTHNPDVADLIHRSAEFLATIDDPRELQGQPRPAFMHEIEALAATRPQPRAERARKPAPRKAALRAAAPPRGKTRQPAASLGASHHQRHCTICSHPDRDEIDAEFIEWFPPDDIAREYKVSRRAIYRHARALGLFARRNSNLRLALGRLVECVDHVEPTADSIVRAIHALARINDDGQWVEPPAHVIVSSGGIHRQASARGHRPVAISLDPPALAGAIDFGAQPALPESAPDENAAELPGTAGRVETHATR